MKRMTPMAASIAALCLLVLAGCSASSKLTTVWKEPTLEMNSLKRMLVLGVAPNSSVRHVFEDTFATGLKSKGVDAVTSYSIVGDAPLDSAKIVAALQQSGADAVFITRMVDRKTVETYYPPTTSVVGGPAPYYSGSWYGYYSMGYAYTTSPGYTVQNQVVNIETNLYRLSDTKLVWSALSESWLEASGNPGKEIQPFVDQLIMGLMQSKVVGEEPKKK